MHSSFMSKPKGTSDVWVDLSLSDILLPKFRYPQTIPDIRVIVATFFLRGVSDMGCIPDALVTRVGPYGPVSPV